MLYTGKIVNERGDALAGATVVVKGTRLSPLQTNWENFQLNAGDLQAPVLEISSWAILRCSTR